MDLDSDGDLDVLSATEGKSNTLFLHFAPDDTTRLLDGDAWTTVPLPQSDGDTRWLFCLPLKPGVFLAAGKGDNAGVYRYTCEGPPRDAASWKAERLGDAGWVMTMKALDQHRVLMSNRRPPNPGLFIIEEPLSESPVLRRVAESDEPLMFADYVLRPDNALPTVYAGLQATAWQSFTPDGGSYRVTRHPLPAWSGTGKGVAVGDLDGDGLEDLALTCEHAEDKVGVWWISNVAAVGGKATNYRPVTNHIGVKFDRIELIDLDGDDDLDLITCEERDGLGVIWYENPLN
jgi:hypothetical protein